MADLKDIELARVGEFELSTGKQRFTPEMLADAARRASAAGDQLRVPLKLGHTDPRNDGEPAFGWLHNVRVEADGVLRGDAHGVPQWLAEHGKTAYPDRSIEANILGKDEGMELTGLALLGQTPPGISTLQSWRELPTLIAAAAAMPIQSFAVAYAAIRDTPQTPAAEPVTITPTQKESDAMSDTLSKGLRERLGVAAEIDETGLLTALDEALGEKAEPAVTPEAIAAAFKLTPEQVTTALAAAAKPAETVVPDGKALISQAVLDELTILAKSGAEARKVQLVDERDRFITASIGIITPARREFWTKKYDIDPEGTRSEIEELSKLHGGLPIAASGRPGDIADLSTEPISEAEAEMLASFTGTSKEGFLR